MQHSPLLSILYILIAALGTATILHKAKQPTIIGYLLGGFLVGPHAFGLVPYENLSMLSEIGVGLLMFTIGLELSLKKLLYVKYVAILGGSIQIVLICLMTLVLAQFLPIQWSATQTLIIGFTLSLSSTAVVLRVLSDRGEIGSTHGNISTGILLYQDILVIPMLALIPVIAQGTAFGYSNILFMIFQFLAFIILLFTSTRFFVPKFLQFVAKIHSKELFSISVLAICLIVAVLTEWFGLSLALGTFLAGLIISDSDFNNQAASEILPLRDSFGAIFFASIGMQLDPTFILHSLGPFLALLAFIFFAKFLCSFIVIFLFRYPVKTSTFTALSLTQIGEFSFLILLSAKQLHLIDDTTMQLILSNTILSIITTPYVMKLGPWIAKHLQFLEKTEATPEGTAVAQENQRAGHIILCGYGPTGSIVMQKMQKAGLPIVVIDLNYRVIQSLKAQNIVAIYGDASSLPVLKAAGIETAAMLVVTIPDPIAMREIAKQVQHSHPKLPLYFRVKYNSEKNRLISLGASEVVWEEYEAGQELSRRIFNYLRLPTID